MLTASDADLALPELLWTLRSSVAAVEVRIDLLRKTWPCAPPEWLPEEEARALLRPHLDSSFLASVIDAAQKAPPPWSQKEQVRTRNLLSLVEPCELHVLQVRLEAISGLAELGCRRCHLKLRLGQTSPWMESSYFFTPVAGCADVGCILQEHFEFQIPIASGDALESFFTPNGATALEIQVLEDDVLLHGELSTLELLACVTCAPQGRVKSCIALETPHSRTSASLRACSMPGLIEGPQIHLELQHSTTLAPLDAMPYWLCPTSSTSSIPDVESDGLRLTRLTLRRLDVMGGAMERAMAMGKCLEIQEHHCSRCSMLASAIANQELIASVSSDDSTPASGMAHHAVWLVLELLLWSFEGALLGQLSLCHQLLPSSELLSLGDNSGPPLVASLTLGTWGKLEVELAVPTDEATPTADAEVEQVEREEMEAPLETPAIVDTDEVIESDVGSLEHTADAEDVVVESVEFGHKATVENGDSKHPDCQCEDGDPSPAKCGSTVDLGDWLEESFPDFTTVAEVAQLAVDMISKPQVSLTSVDAVIEEVPSMVASLEMPLAAVVDSMGDFAAADTGQALGSSVFEGKDDLDSTVASIDGLGLKDKGGPQRSWEPTDEPEPAAEESLGVPEGDIFHFERSGRRAPRARELSPGVGAGAPPAKIPSTFQIAKAVTEVVAEAPAVYQLGGRGPLPAELLVRQVSLGATSPLPRDLLPRDPVSPNKMVPAAAPTKLVTPVEAPIGPMVSAPTAAGPTSPEALDAPSPEELPMVSFRRSIETSAVMSVMSPPADVTWSSPNLGSTRSPPGMHTRPPRWATLTWSPERRSLAWGGSTRSTMTPRRRLEDADGKLSTPKASRSISSNSPRWSDRLDLNTKRLARILRGAPRDESSDSS